MRSITIGFGVAALLASTSVLAAPQGGGAGGKGDTGGKGGSGPEGSTAAGAGGTQEAAVGNDTSLTPFGGRSTPSNPDATNGAKVEQKPWEVSGTFETHRLLMQQYVTDSSSKTFNVFFATVKYLFTDADILTLGGGAQQVFYSDPGEPGVRASDLSLSYTHIFPLPEKFRLSTTATITAPIGFYSQLASNITSPGVSVGLSRRFGDLLVSAGLRGTYFWDRYTTAAEIGSGQSSVSGQTNPKWSAGGYLSAEYAMPFHRPLSVGAVASTGYTWFYDVGQCPGQTTCNGATTAPNIDNQPFQQSYGGEIFVRYLVPDLGGFKSDLLLALANGDPSLGYPAVLHDGVVHPYVLYYNSAEVYFALEGRY